jgi:glutamate--glyoxylate aminotransferase
VLLRCVSLQVYQENIYQDERPFVAARKVMKEMGEPYASGVELLSFHTVSKVRWVSGSGLLR